ncbi:MAG: thiamine pyrophosphate-binding protein [Thermoleophilaceae bacterium]
MGANATGVAGSTAAEAAVEALRQGGVDVVFGNPGTTEIPLIKQLTRDDAGLRYVLTLHEGTAVSAAMGNALATGRPGVALVHAMPGLSNGLSMYFNAWRSGVPLVLIVGQQDRRHQYLNPILQADLTDILRAVSKSVWEAKTAAEIPDMLTQSLVAAASSPPGPVLLAVPVDLWDEPVAAPARAVSARPRRSGPAAGPDVAALADALAGARSPVFVAGDLVGMSDAGGSLAELAELAGATAFWAPGSSLANFPTSSPCHRGPIFPNAASFERTFGGADLTVFFGVDLHAPILFAGTEMVPPACRVAAVTESPADPLGALRPDLFVHGDLTAAIPAIADRLRERLSSGVPPELEQRRERIVTEGPALRDKLLRRSLESAAETPMSGRSAVATILDAAPMDAMVVDESVSNAWVSLLGSFDDPVSYLAPARGGALGHALGVAVGAKIAREDRPALVIVGDGAAIYGVQGLWTIAHEELPVVVCVLNNNGYAILKDFLHSEHFSPELAADPLAIDSDAGRMSIAHPAVDVPGLARSWGLDAVRVDDAASCRSAVQEAFASGRPWVIDVQVRHAPKGGA